MTRIAIVEDEAAVREQLAGYVQRYTRQYGTQFEVTMFTDGVEILEDYRPVYDIIFLDVEMQHLDGMETARRIRELDSDVLLIFITNMAQYAIKGVRRRCVGLRAQACAVLCVLAAAAKGCEPAGQADAALSGCAGGRRHAPIGRCYDLLYRE